MIFIFEANKNFQDSEEVNNFRGMLSREFPELIREINDYFVEDALHYEDYFYGFVRKLIIKNDTEFVLNAKGVKFKGQVTLENLKKLKLTSLKEISYKYSGVQLIACYDEEHTNISRAFKSILEFETDIR